MKKNIFLISFAVLLSGLFAEYPIIKSEPEDDYKRIFSEAQIAFDEQNYGLALKLSESAKSVRKEQIGWEIYTLENAFKAPEVKRVGGSIEAVVKVLEEREDYSAIRIIHSYQRFLGKDFFNDSTQKLLSYIKGIAAYPEADFLSGCIYRLEGEYEIADKYFTQAFKNASVLDIPDQKYDILYALSEISLLKNDYEKYEKDLLLILAQDNAFKDENLVSAMMNTIGSVKPDSLEKFFQLYRANNFKLLNAYFSLSTFYQKANANKKALRTSALGVLTGFSKILSVIKKRNPEYEYRNLASLLFEVSMYPDIIEWGIDNNIWRGFNYFAEQAMKNNYPVFATQLYNVIKEYSPEEYWRDAADVKLKKILNNPL